MAEDVGLGQRGAADAAILVHVQVAAADADAGDADEGLAWAGLTLVFGFADPHIGRTMEEHRALHEQAEGRVSSRATRPGA